MIIIAVNATVVFEKKKKRLISTYRFSDAKPSARFFLFFLFRDVFSSDVDQQSDTKCSKERNFLLHTEMKSEIK